MEIPFFFDHVDDVQFMMGTGRDRYALATRMASAFAAFARSGNPNHSGLPNWPAFDPATRATMVFEAEPRMVNDPYGEERRGIRVELSAPGREAVRLEDERNEVGGLHATEAAGRAGRHRRRDLLDEVVHRHPTSSHSRLVF